MVEWQVTAILLPEKDRSSNVRFGRKPALRHKHDESIGVPLLALGWNFSAVGPKFLPVSQPHPRS